MLSISCISRRHGNVQITMQIDGKIDAIRVKLESEMGEVEVGDIHFGPERFLVRQPDWVAATLDTNGSLQVSVDVNAVKPGTWLGFVYVRADAGWQPIVSSKDDLLTFIAVRGISEPDSIRTQSEPKES